ncbi:hypothetical protein VNO78_35914 [Psophocarpus tetragonolobus]|uniref:Uncharacterized protein n=1 Tax=Psophocarpus tetragonolobus TaxID=3891 RepID=A0AAN9NLY3_PSOTE
MVLYILCKHCFKALQSGVAELRSFENFARDLDEMYTIGDCRSTSGLLLPGSTSKPSTGNNYAFRVFCFSYLSH